MRRGQPERLSKLQREILTFYARCGGFVHDMRRNHRRWDWYAEGEGDEIRGFYPESFYRSRRNLIEKGYLRYAVEGRSTTENGEGLRLTEKAYDRMPELRAIESGGK